MTWGPQIGAELAGYRLVRQLGRGGMGLVYEAEHLQLGRKASLKVLDPDLARDEAFRARFIRESQLIAAVDHPNIVPIYDAGEEEGVLYIAMRYVDGCDLKALLERERHLSAERALSILEPVGAALAAAHARDLVHRDVKPGNILIEEASGRAFLTDFGLAKEARSRGSTKTGFFLGTVDYVSPEQIEGKLLGAAADVYALGCVLYECFAGRPPFAKPTDVAVISAHMYEPPPRVTEIRPDLPIAFDDVIAKALAKSESDRYQACDELMAAARAGLERAPLAVAARPVSIPSPTPARAETQPVDSNLSAPTTPFVGRKTELAAVREILGRDDVRLVTLTGPGGTGKTRLAMEVAQELLEVFPDGVFFVSLAAIGDPALVIPSIADALGVTEQAVPASGGGEAVTPPVFEPLGTHLRDKNTLLVLDNFEQILAATPLLAELLAGCPKLKLLVTSQSSLHLRGGRDYPVPPLELPDLARLPGIEALSENAAVALFVDRAQAVKPDFELSGENAASIAEICLRLDGLPLAIELAAARTKLLSPKAMLERLGSRLQLLTGGARDLPSRHQTLRSTIDWSYDLLDPSEQILFAQLAVFVDGCTLDAAEAVCGAPDELPPGGVMDALESLIDKSLLRQREAADGELRFSMLETIREYALYRLIQRGELEGLRDRHAEHYLALAETAEPELLLANQAAWVKRLTEEAGNLRAAMAWSLESGELEAGLRIAGALPRFWSVCGHVTEGRSWLKQALDRSTGVSPPVRAKALFADGYAALAQGDYLHSVRRFEEGLALDRELGDMQGAAMCLAQLGWLLMTQGQHERATAVSEESLALARQVEDTRIESVALSNLADGAAQRGDYEQAAALYQQSLALRRAQGDRRNIANALLNLGRTELLRGERDQALILLQEGLTLARELGDTWSISVGLSNLGRLALEENDPARAAAFLTEALVLCRERGDRKIAAECLDSWADVAAADGQPARAARLSGAANALREAIGASPSHAERTLHEKHLASVRQALGETDFESESAVGRSFGLEQAVAYALAPPLPEGQQVESASR
jgi:predicted ATPase/Tfp pilus assembly protein PilF